MSLRIEQADGGCVVVVEQIGYERQKLLKFASWGEARLFIHWLDERADRERKTRYYAGMYKESDPPVYQIHFRGQNISKLSREKS